MILKPMTTEKAVMAIESGNILTFETEMKRTKQDIKQEVERLFDVKVEKVRTSIKDNKKQAYVKLNKKFPAIDVATKLGII
ncbi:50S ribosomal protein L23 [Candidatus Pacearchaeota archaeon]|nr:50S ribosomal protein L23 [Candidatus Pacearchaeota archaeon]